MYLNNFDVNHDLPKGIPTVKGTEADEQNQEHLHLECFFPGLESHGKQQCIHDSSIKTNKQ
jgi:hypothetical protein